MKRVILYGGLSQRREKSSSDPPLTATLTKGGVINWDLDVLFADVNWILRRPELFDTDTTRNPPVQE